MMLIAILRIKDQILTIDECLGKLSTLVDEIVILDNGSTDGTLEVYKKYPKIIKILHTVGFDEGRDKVMLLEEAKKSKPDWILWIDGDEVFENSLTRDILDGYMKSPYNRITFRMCNFWLSKTKCRYDHEYYLYTLHPQRSMWRNVKSAYFRNVVIHNGDIQGVPGKSFISPYRIKHHGYVYKQKIEEKMKIYILADKQEGRDYQNTLDGTTHYKTFLFIEPKSKFSNFLYIHFYKYLCNTLWLFERLRIKIKKLFNKNVRHSVLNIKCHICGSDSTFLLKKDGFDEYICSKCKLSFVYPQPDADWLKTEVYSLESGYQSNKKVDLSIEKEGKRYGRVLDYMAKSKPNGKLLDVGCSSGQVMYWARKRGLRPTGVEINKRTANLAIKNGFEVFNGFLEDSQFEKGTFDLIFLGDVLEHVNNPRKFIEDAKSFLKRDGLIVISTPNVNCFWSDITLVLYRWFTIPWTSASPPYHLFQFSFENLNMLMRESQYHNVKTFFLPPPSLKYELGSLHLFRKYKEQKSFLALLFMVCSYAIYTVVYGINLVVHPFIKKDFQMSAVYSQ